MAVQFPNQWQSAYTLPGNGSAPNATWVQNGQSAPVHSYPTPPEYLTLSHPVPQWQQRLVGNSPSSNRWNTHQGGSSADYSPQTIRQYGPQYWGNTPINQQSVPQPGVPQWPQWPTQWPDTMTQTQSQQIVPGDWQTNWRNSTTASTPWRNNTNPTLWQQTPVTPVQSIQPNNTPGTTLPPEASGLTLNVEEAVGTSNGPEHPSVMPQAGFSGSLMTKQMGPLGTRFSALA